MKRIRFSARPWRTRAMRLYFVFTGVLIIALLGVGTASADTYAITATESGFGSSIYIPDSGPPVDVGGFPFIANGNGLLEILDPSGVVSDIVVWQNAPGFGFFSIDDNPAVVQNEVNNWTLNTPVVLQEHTLADGSLGVVYQIDEFGFPGGVDFFVPGVPPLIGLSSIRYTFISEPAPEPHSWLLLSTAGIVLLCIRKIRVLP